MKKIIDILKINNIKPIKYIKKGNIYIIEDNKKKYIIKKQENNDILYKYLESRSFNYYPKILFSNDEYMLTEYIDEIEIPKEQKIMDLVDLISLLHNKTTIYKETTKDDFKQIYEDIKGNIEYLYNYYDQLMQIIESKTYYSPSEYLLARNIFIFFKSLEYCNTKIEEWYYLIENNTRQRYVLLHNNLDLSHFLNNDNSYLISWSKSKVDLPIFDLYKLYKRHCLDFDFIEVINRYELNYPLKKEEKILFYILISLPDKLIIQGSEYEKTKIIYEEINKLIKSDKLISFEKIDNDNNSYNSNN